MFRRPVKGRPTRPRYAPGGWRMNYCKKCIMPDTRPETVFNDEGVCDACVSAERKKTIAWDAREKEFLKILERYRCNDGRRYDCVIPVSGGKDSCHQAHTMKY